MINFWNQHGRASVVGVDLHVPPKIGGACKSAPPRQSNKKPASYSRPWYVAQRLPDVPGSFKPFVEAFSHESMAAINAVYAGSGFEPWPEGEGLKSMTRAKSTVSGIEVSFDYEAGTGMTLVGGMEYSHSRLYDASIRSNGNLVGRPMVIEDQLFLPFQYFGRWVDHSQDYNWVDEAKRTVISSYLQSTFNLKQLLAKTGGSYQLTLTTGLRYDDYDDFGSNLSPRAGIIFAPNTRLAFKFLYGQAFRAPTFREMYLKNNPSLIGNPNMKPEKVKTTELQISYRFGDRASTSLGFFRSTTSDLIQSPEVLQVNVGEIEAEGAELETRFVLSKNTNGFINVTYNDVQDLSSDNQFFVGGIPRFYGNLGINTSLSERVSGSLRLNYYGKQRRSEAVAEGIRVDQRPPVEDRILLYGSMQLKNLLPDLHLSVSGFNLTDEEYSDADITGVIYDDIPRPGRSYMISLTYEF